MAPGFGLSDSVGSLMEVAKSLARRASNTVTGQDFNRLAFEEAEKSPYEWVDDDYDEEKWSGLLRKAREDEADGNKEFAVKEMPSKFSQVAHKLSEKALGAASQVSGVSAEYAGYAAKFLAVETAREIGWLATCKTTTEILTGLKKRFPVLDDLKRAYENGIKDGQEQTRRASITYRTHPPSPGITHPRDVTVSSNLDDRAITSDHSIQTNLAYHKGKRIYDPSIHGDLEEVSADPNNLYSDNEASMSEKALTCSRPSIRFSSQIDSQHDSRELVTQSNPGIDTTRMENIRLNDSDEEDGVMLSPGAEDHLAQSKEGSDYFSKAPKENSDSQ